MVKAGERHGLDWLIYNPLEFYRYYLYAASTSDAVAESLIQTFPDAQAFADIGAGTGTYAAALRRRNKRVVACERSLAGRAFSVAQRVPSSKFDLLREHPAPTPVVDTIYCFEVAEHLPPDLGDRLVAFIAGTAKHCVRLVSAMRPTASGDAGTVVFSAAHPEQGGLAHINEQPKRYWVDRFARHGLTVDQGRSDRLAATFDKRNAPWWLVENAIVFTAR